MRSVGLDLCKPPFWQDDALKDERALVQQAMQRPGVWRGWRGSDGCWNLLKPVHLQTVCKRTRREDELNLGISKLNLDSIMKIWARLVSFKQYLIFWSLGFKHFFTWQNEEAETTH